MKRLTLFSGVLFLAACSSGPPPSSLVVACRAEVERDPRVHQLEVFRLGSMFSDPETDQKLAQAKREAMATCLAHRSLGRRSGPEVEPVNPTNY